MGSRAHYVLIDAQGWTLRYSHWGAAVVDRDLIWGPGHAQAFIQAQAPIDEWMNDRWCEGGALMDCPHRLLLFFGGQEMQRDAAAFRLEMEVFSRLWPGWTVRWAYEGLVEFVDHLGLDRALVRSPPREVQDFAPALFPDMPVGLWSVRWPDGSVRVYPSNLEAHEVGLRSPELLNQLAGLQGLRSFTLYLLGEVPPQGGVHLDPVARTVDLWSTHAVQDLSLRMAERWPGWRFTHHGPRWESQVALAGQALTLEPPSRAWAQSDLILWLASGKGVDPEQLRELLQRVYGGQDLRFSPSFSEHVPMDLPEEARAAALAAVLSALPDPEGFVP